MANHKVTVVVSQVQLALASIKPVNPPKVKQARNDNTRTYCQSLKLTSPKASDHAKDFDSRWNTDDKRGTCEVCTNDIRHSNGKHMMRPNKVSDKSDRSKSKNHPQIGWGWGVSEIFKQIDIILKTGKMITYTSG